MAAADLVPDADGLLDLVVVGTSGSNSLVTILRNLGPPSYGFAVNETYSVPGQDHSEVVTVGDYNGDGLVDIAHAGHYGGTYVRFAQPSGWFGEPLLIPSLGWMTSGLASADFDGDGRCDLVIRDSVALSVLHGTQGEGFDRGEDYPQCPAQGQQEKIVIADFNGDGRLDIAHGNQYTMQVYVYYAREEGGFAPPQAIDVGTYTGNIAVGDVDGDGRMDLVAAPDSTFGGNNNVQEGVVLYSRGAGGFSSPVRFASVHYQRSLGTADLDRDGRAEILVAGGYNRNSVAVLRSRPRGLIGTGRDYLVGNNPSALAAGDFDRDGFSDLAVLNRDDDDVTVLWAVGDGSLERRGPDLHVGVSPRDIVAGYFDDDDVLDLCVTNGGSNSLTIWHGDGPSGGSFSTREFLYPTLPGSPTALVAGYFDDDDRMDVAFLAGGKVVVLRGVPGGSLDDEHPEQYTVASGAVDIVQADLNGDGLADLATVAAQTISVLYGLADGTFAAAEDYSITAPAGAWSARIGAGDVNGDGLVDLIASSPTPNPPQEMNSYVTVLYGQPGGGFGNLTRFNTGSESLGEIIVDDFDRDTLPDVAVSGYAAQHIFFGQPDGTLVHQEYAHRIGNQTATDPMAVGDFDGDGRPDIASVRWTGTGVTYASVMLNQSNAKIRGELAVTAMTAPSSGTTADVVSVSWTVQNQASTPLTGKWTDAVYLARDELWDINDIRLGTLDFLGTLTKHGTSGDSYSQTLDVALPGVFEGNWYILVRTDATDAVAEQNGEADNLMARPIAIEWPELPVCAAGSPCPGLTTAFSAQRRALYYKLQTVGGEDLQISLEGLYEEGANELYVRFGAPPTRSVYDACYGGQFDTYQTVRIPGTQAGTYYVLAFAAELPPTSPALFIIKAQYLPFTFTEVTPERGGNTGNVTVTLLGSGFQAGAQVALLPYGATPIQPVRTNLDDAGTISATFDLDGKPAGLCGVRVTNPGGAAIVLDEVFTIEAGVELKVAGTLAGPAAARPGRKATYYANILNTGNVDIPYLLVDISVPGEYANGISIAYPEIAYPPPVDGLDWTTVNPTVVLDGRMHYPLLWRDVRPSGGASVKSRLRGMGAAAGNLKFDVDIAPGAAAHTSYDVAVGLAALTREQFIAVLGNDAEVIRTLMLAEPPLNDAIAQLQNDPSIWGPLSEGLQNQVLWRQAYLDGWAALGLLDSDGRATGIDKARDWLVDSSSGLLSAAGVFAVLPGMAVAPWACWAAAAGGCYAFMYDKCNGMGLPTACADAASLCALTSPVCWPVWWYWNTATVYPGDPDYKFSPNGWGPSGFVSRDDVVGYVVQFENMPAATATALKVEVADQLHGNLDWGTLTLDGIAFGEVVIKVPPGLSHYEGRIQMDGWTWNETDGWHRYDEEGNPVMPLVVDIDAGIDVDTGLVHWTLTCADPNTGNFPEDPYAGFLPPNQEAIFCPDPNSPDPNNPVMIHPGEGYLTYSVRPKAGLATGTQITNKATIVFDWNASIDTPTVLNTIDALPPSGAVTALPAQTVHATFPVCWTGQDDPGGSGVFTYTVYVSDNGGPYGMWLMTEDACGTFTDTKLNHTYRFYSVAQDHVGNVEAPPADPNGMIVPDAVTTLPGLVGDMNCDGRVTFADIDPFVQALAGESAWIQNSPGCPWLDADCNRDGRVTFADIDPFVALIGTTSPQPPTGACCVAGACTVTTEASCSGTWKGAGTTCAPNPCLCAGDMNCDGRVTFADIELFVQALMGESAWNQHHPGCPWLNADCNGDGNVTFADIDPFVARIGRTCP